MASTTAHGLSASPPIPIDSAHWWGHGQCLLHPMSYTLMGHANHITPPIALQAMASTTAHKELFDNEPSIVCHNLFLLRDHRFINPSMPQSTWSPPRFHLVSDFFVLLSLYHSSQWSVYQSQIWEISFSFVYYLEMSLILWDETPRWDHLRSISSHDPWSWESQDNSICMYYLSPM